MKNERDVWAKKAKDVTKRVEKDFPDKICDAIANSIVYGDPDKTPSAVSKGSTPQFSIENIDTVSAIFKHSNSKKLAVLNFADFKEPANKFMDGYLGQEQALCHESILYSVLKAFPEYYRLNKKNLNKGMYCNRAIYTPNVLFFRDDKRAICDVITCAAPNFSTGIRYKTVTKIENTKALKARIQFVNEIATEQKVDTLVLGAWGCEVSKQDPTEVATLIKKEFDTTGVKKIYFAIPVGNKSKNYAAFSQIY